MEPAALLDALKRSSLLAGIPEDKLSAFSHILRPIDGKAGQVVFEEGSHGDSLYIVAEGAVRIEKKVEAGGDHGYKALARVGEGQFFGEMALVEERPRSARAVLDEDGLLLQLSKSVLFKWLKAEPETAISLLIQLMNVISGRLRSTSEELTLLFDLSHLILETFSKPETFLHKVVAIVAARLPGTWTIGGYLYNRFNEDTTLAASLGPNAAKLDETLELTPTTRAGWVDDSHLRLVFHHEDHPQGALMLWSEKDLDRPTRDQLLITLTTVSHLIASALSNIGFETEERMRDRLKTSRGDHAF